jgi:copper(I)-binding protein
MNRISRVAIACFAMAAMLAACKPADAPVPTATTEVAETAPAAASAATGAVVPAATTPADTPVVGADYPVARDACLAEVARQTGVAQDKLVATEVLWAEAGVGVTVQVPDAKAPWSCLSDEKGKVQGAAYTGSEGKL